MKINEKEQKEGGKVKNIIHIKTVKKIIARSKKGKMWKKKFTLWFDKFSQRQQTFPGEFFPDDLYQAHPLFPCTSCQPQSRGDEKSYRCSLPNENIVVRGFSLIFSVFPFSSTFRHFFRLLRFLLCLTSHASAWNYALRRIPSREQRIYSPDVHSTENFACRGVRFNRVCS